MSYCYVHDAVVGLLHSLADELLFFVQDRVAAADPRPLVSRACRDAESRHRYVPRLCRTDLLRLPPRPHPLHACP